jgi:hypothetical protein
MPKGVYNRKPVEERFWSKVIPAEDSDCLLWIGARHCEGYGLISIGGGIMQLAHVVAHTLTYGPPEDCVLHLCDVRLCVNPAHLYDGTRGDNIQDAWDRERRVMRDVRGENNPFVVLTEELVLAMRAQHTAGWSITGIALEHGVGRTTAGAAIRGDTWSHL